MPAKGGTQRRGRPIHTGGLGGSPLSSGLALPGFQDQRAPDHQI